MLNSNVIENITSCVNIKKRNFRQTILDSLDQLRDTDPKKYWKLIKSLKEDSESDSIQIQWSLNTGFSTLLNLTNNLLLLSPNLIILIQRLKTWKTWKTICELDFLISSKEISDGISKLKSGKASGLDGIPNEMLKAGSSIVQCFKSYLISFFHQVSTLCNGLQHIYLQYLSQGMLVNLKITVALPAINSCIAKLFNTVLNDRFDKFLEEHKIISRFQTGFAKKSRTTDHMFVLKTLIDKYINKKGGKLFACFVDFRRAFDTVIHEGIKYKLLKSGIGGNFYSIIKDMYSKNDLC